MHEGSAHLFSRGGGIVAWARHLLNLPPQPAHCGRLQPPLALSLAVSRSLGQLAPLRAASSGVPCDERIEIREAQQAARLAGREEEKRGIRQWQRKGTEMKRPAKQGVRRK